MVKVNSLEIINRLDESSNLLQEIFESLVELNMGVGQFDCGNSVQLELSVKKLNDMMNKINKITDYRELH